jgi:hypothetical protein
MMGDAHSWLNGDALRSPTFLSLCQRAEKMKLLSFAFVISAALCSVLAGCASGVDPGPPAVVRTPPPQNYEKTVTNYLAFRIRGPQKNAEISVGTPEPAACALDAYTTSSRGWVVPVAYITRSGEVTGKDTIRINAKQYYFWFLGNTIAGITPRLELCPGVGSTFESPTPDPAAAAVTTGALPAPASADAVQADRAKATSAPKPKTSTKKGASSGKAKPAAATKKAESAAPR